MFPPLPTGKGIPTCVSSAPCSSVPWPCLVAVVAAPTAAFASVQRLQQADHHHRFDELRGAGDRFQHLGRRPQVGGLQRHRRARTGNPGNRGAGHREGRDQSRAGLRRLAARLPAQRRHPCGRRQHRHRHPGRSKGARVVRSDRASRVEGAGHQRLRRHQSHGQEGPPHDHLEPEALCLED